MVLLTTDWHQNWLQNLEAIYEPFKLSFACKILQWVAPSSLQLGPTNHLESTNHILKESSLKKVVYTCVVYSTNAFLKMLHFLLQLKASTLKMGRLLMSKVHTPATAKCMSLVSIIVLKCQVSVI